MGTPIVVTRVSLFVLIPHRFLVSDSLSNKIADARESLDPEVKFAMNPGSQREMIRQLTSTRHHFSLGR